MRKPLSTVLILVFFLTAVPSGNGWAQGDQDVGSTVPITIKAGELTATFVDNRSYGPVHKKGYNGISELRHASATDDLFVPSYAGFNLEHFFGGDPLENLMEPRTCPMTLTQPDDRSARLHQPPTSLSKVETDVVFRLVPPHAIDVTVEVVLHDLSMFPHGYAGIFWASYINAPEDRRIYFWGISDKNDKPRWISAYSEKHGLKSTHRYVGDRVRTWFAPDFNVVLAKGFSDYRYLEPFYYGRRGKMVYAVFFDRTEGIRFSQSPTGGGDRNPAWDHHLIIPNPEKGKVYSYRARLVYKEFVSAEDIRDEFRQWYAGAAGE